MAGSWIETTLGNVADFMSGGTPSKGNPSFWNGSVPWVSAKDMKRFFLDDTEDHVTEEGMRNGTRLVPPKTVLLLTRGMTLLNDVPICVARRPMTFNQDVKALRPKDGVHDDFLPYLILGHKHRLLGLVDLAGHGTGRLNTDELKSLDVFLPTPPEQHAIAHILGTLDDKIELNRRMNETLEAMARALFKSWFVDFDPVRAKLDGRKPAGVDKATAALFPDAFQDSPLGKIPKGWRVCPVPEAIEVNPPRSLRKGQVAPYLDMKNMPTQGHRPAGWITRPMASGTKFTNGDTLLARITPCLENGKTAYVDFLDDEQVGGGSTEYIVLRPKTPLPTEYGYFLARSAELRAHAIQNMTGSSGRQRVPAECLAKFMVVVPSEGVAECFGRVVGSLMARAKWNSEDSTILAALRDALLPKLLSGEIRVPETQRVLEEHGS